MSRPRLEVEGLKEFRKALKDLDDDLPKALRMALNKSVEIIVDNAQPDVPSRSGRARSSIKARSTQTTARVSGGGNKAPYYPWLDFGGAVGRRDSVRRPFLKNGRYIYNAYFKHRDEFGEILEGSLIDVAKASGIGIT